MHLAKTQLSSLALMALALCPLTALETQAQYQLTQFPWGFPSGINNGGTIVVNGALDPETFEDGPALVDGDSVTLISIPNAFFPNLGGINPQGTVVGSAYTEDFSSSFGFVRTKHGQVTVFNIPGAAAINPSGINSRGVVVGFVSDENFSSHGFIWDATGPTLFDAPDADSTELTGINASGSAVGNYTIGGISRAFSLTASRFTPLNIPGVSSSSASGINSRGQIVGSYSSPAHPSLDRGYVYDRGAVTPVDFPLSEEWAPPSFPPRPFNRGALGSGTVTYIRTLQFTALTGINDRGDIIGRAGSLYTPVVECGGCGLTSDDFFFRVYFDTFSGESDGSRSVHVKSAGKPRQQRIAGGTEARNFIRGQKP